MCVCVMGWGRGWRGGGIKGEDFGLQGGWANLSGEQSRLSLYVTTSGPNAPIKLLISHTLSGVPKMIGCVTINKLVVILYPL